MSEEDRFQQELLRLQQEQLLRTPRNVQPLPNGRILVDGQKRIDFSANDYLNLALHPRLFQAATEVAKVYGCGARASALVTGHTHWHQKLEQQLAAFEQTESAVLFPTGYAANLGVISALVGKGDTIFCDRFNHASLVDGCRLSGARLRIYRHDQLDILERELNKAQGESKRLIVTDSVFSMDGDAAPLSELCDLTEKYAAELLVDEAHATGILGERGSGYCERLGLEERVRYRIGTLSKALGTLGGFTVGTEAYCSWIWNHAREQIYSTALPPMICAAAVMALQLIQQEPWRRRALHQRCQQLREGLIELSLQGPERSIGPIIPVIIGDAAKTMQAAGQLQQLGFEVAAIRPPTVAAGTSRLRISLSCAHSEEDVTALLEALQQVLPG